MNNIVELKKEIILTPLGGEIIENKLLFSERYSKGIWIYDLETKEVDILGENKGKEKTNMCSEVVRVGECVYFIPLNATQMTYFDLKEGKIGYVKLPTGLRKSKCGFYCGVEQDGILYLFGYEHNKVYGYDTKKLEFREFQWDKNTSSIVTVPEGLYIRSAVRKNGVIYSVSINHNSIFIINTAEMLITEKKLSADNTGYSGICVYKGELLLIPKDGDVFVRYNIETGKEYYIDCKLGSGEWSYNGGIIWHDYLIAIPCYGRYFIRIALKDGSIDYFNKNFENEEYDSVDYACGMALLHNDTLLVSYLNKKYLLSLSLQSWGKRINKTIIKTNKINRFENESIVRETEIDSLERLILSL